MVIGIFALMMRHTPVIVINEPGFDRTIAVYR
jgi:hypothetical protein